MISLISIFRRFVSVVRYGWDDAEFRGLATILAGWVGLGTIVYAIYEDWSVADSFYFSVMTLTTIGYGDLTPTTTAMRLYTVPYAVLGIGLFVAFNARLAMFAVESRRKGKESKGAQEDSPGDEGAGHDLDR